MSLLERWDRRNQRTFEWQRHMANEEPRRRKKASWIALAGFVLVVMVVRRVLSRFIGFGWTMTILVAIAVGCFTVGFIGQRRKRRAWEASQDGPA